ncbi:acetyltransferase [Nakamurella silvestris]|nr:acetyltransferase [Nakamurella silvestris]
MSAAVNRPLRAYAPGLDGLRAIAVLAVIGYHAGIPWLPGGFLGVDVFFVISGYLVTTLLQREYDRTGRVSLPKFWLRRIRRLVPALVVMLVAVCALALAFRQDLNAGLRSQAFAAAGFVSNWQQIAQGNSYVAESTPALLTHLWSLAVEEQFYLIWPIVLAMLLLFVRHRRRRVLVAAGVALASVLLMLWLYVPGADPTRVYVGTDTHGFSLILGACLGLARLPSLIDPAPRSSTSRLRGYPALIGPVSLGVLLLLMVTLSDTSTLTYRGGLVLTALAAAALVAVTARGGGLLDPVLTARPMRHLGLRSYSLYLWHWPMLVIAARINHHAVPAWVAAGLAVILSLLCAEVSWRLVEDPIRRWGLAGYTRRLRSLLVADRAVSKGRRRVGWAVTGTFAVTALTAACSVVAAPAQTSLEVQLAAAEQAIEAAEAAPVVDATGTADAGVESSGTEVPVPATGAQPSSPETTAQTGSTHSPHRRPHHRPVHRPTPATPPPPTGPQITAIGDSVMLGSAPQLLTEMPGIAVDAVVSRQIWDLGTVLTAAERAGTLRSTVVIGLGTNGAASTEEILQALNSLGPDRVVVLVNTFEDRPWQQEINDNLAAVAASRAHTCVADWHAAIEARQELLGPDGVHPGPEGAQLYATTVAGTVQTCR